jgi:DNA-binding CsgD family transcriptional regulator
MPKCPTCGQEVGLPDLIVAIEMLRTVTLRELEVLGYAMEGCTNKTIASCLGCSEHTVHAHTQRVYVKLGVHNRTEAVMLCLKLGLLKL